MKQLLTQAGAKERCAKYQYLLQDNDAQQVYSALTETTGVAPHAIAIAPFDDISKWRFSQYYLQFLNTEKVLSFYSHTDYDVVVLFRQQKSGEPCKFSSLPLEYCLEKQHTTSEGMLFFAVRWRCLTEHRQQYYCIAANAIVLKVN